MSSNPHKEHHYFSGERFLQSKKVFGKHIFRKELGNFLYSQKFLSEALTVIGLRVATGNILEVFDTIQLKNSVQ